MKYFTQGWLAKIHQTTVMIFQMAKTVWNSHPLYATASILITTVQGLVPLATAWITKSLFDLLGQAWRDGFSRNLGSEVTPLLAAQVLLLILSRAQDPLASYINAELNRSVELTIQSRLFGKISSFAGIAYFEMPDFHDTVQLARQGAFMGSQSLSNLIGLARGTITFASFMGVLISHNLALASIVILTAIPQLIVRFKFISQHVKLAREVSPDQRRSFYYSQLLTEPSAIKESLLFDVSHYFLQALIQKYRDIHNSQHHQQLREFKWQSVLGVALSLIESTALIVIIIEAIEGQLSLGDVTLYQSAVMGIAAASLSIISGISSLSEGALLYTHFVSLLALPQPISISSSSVKVLRINSKIELRNVAFRYTDNHPWVLRDVNLTIPAGKCLALVGPNGAGKTTLVKLLTRLYDPTEGQILWNGIDIRDFDPTELRKHIGAISQDFMCYDLTARENIGLGDVEHITNLARIERAARIAGVHDVIMELPQGYASILSRWLSDGQDGANLSGGEWQKVAIARMFMRDADFLILDEPTAALDAESEYEIYRHFAELVAGRTSLLISHRFSTVRMADRIAVLEEGRITEYGTHSDLIALAGCYARLYNMQAEQYR